jgi:SRSO17 transposase
VLLVDESAEEKARAKSAGAGRQYNGRLGKVEMSPVGVLLSYVNLKVAQGLWSWIEGRLLLPEAWFKADQKALRKRLGVPKDLHFKTQVELAWEMIEAALIQAIPFGIVRFDSLYGGSGWLRAQVRAALALYRVEVPVDTQVYLEKPVLGIPERLSKRGRPP